MPNNPASGNGPAMPRHIQIQGKVYLTSNSPRALWQRFLIRRAYRRPVTYADLRRIAHGVAYRDGSKHLCPVGAALFDRIVLEAEKPVFGQSNGGR